MKNALRDSQQTDEACGKNGGVAIVGCTPQPLRF
jgi:hypothetical protein